MNIPKHLYLYSSHGTLHNYSIETNWQLIEEDLYLIRNKMNNSLSTTYKNLLHKNQSSVFKPDALYTD